MSRALLAWMIVAVGCARGGAGPRTAERADGLGPSPVTAHLSTYFRGLRTIEVVVAGKPLPFLLDTGAGLTALSPETAALVGCRPFGRITGFRMTGERVEFQRCTPVELAIGPVRVRDEVAVFDFGHVVPPELPPVHGALSLASLEHVPFTLDLARGELTFETKESLRARTAAAKRATIRLSRDSAGAGLDVMVAVGASPAPIWLELDSGNIVGTILSPAGAEGIQLAAGRVRAGEPEPAPAELDLLGVGRVPVSARIVPLIYDGVLGVDVMERFLLTFDLAHGAMWAAPVQSPHGAPPATGH